MGKSLSVRFPDWLYEYLSKEADLNERSIGGQIRYVLGLYYRKPEVGIGGSSWKDTFENWIQFRTDEVDGEDGTVIPIEDFLRSCTGATDIMPGMLCGMLDILPGSTWGEAAMAALGWIAAKQKGGSE